MTDIVEQTRREITDRIEQLRPVIEEYERLQAAAEALASIPAASATESARPAAPAPRRRGPGRPRHSASARSPRPAGSRKRSGRPKGSGARAQEAVKLIEGQPGITIREMAAKMKITPNYLYRLLPPLEKEGKIAKQGNGWQPTTSSA